MRPDAPPFLPPEDEIVTQIVQVCGCATSRTAGTLSCWQKTDACWRCDAANIPVSWGRNGITACKREGDGCTPSGFFALGPVFGRFRMADLTSCRMKMLELHDELYAVDDPASRYYNRIVDARLTGRDWTSAEAMGRMDARYDLGVVIRHNPKRRPGHGSCIFLHLWAEPDIPTSGCVAMARKDMEALIRWLNPVHHPRIRIA